MSAPPKLKPVRHLVALCDRLDLEPVIRHLLQSECLTWEQAQLIRSHPTSPQRIERLIHLLNSDERVDAFLAALRATKHTDLAELIDPPSDPRMAPSQSEASSNQAGSSSHAAVIQLLPADLDALILRRIEEAMSSPRLAMTPSGASLGRLSGSEKEAETSISSGTGGLTSSIHESDSAQSSTVPLPASQSDPDVLARQVQAAVSIAAPADQGDAKPASENIPGRPPVLLPPGESDPDVLFSQRVREETNSVTLLDAGRDSEDSSDILSPVDQTARTFKPQIVATGSRGLEGKMEPIDVDTRQSVLLTLDRPRREHCCAQISPGKLLLAGGKNDVGHYDWHYIRDCDFLTVGSSWPFVKADMGVSRLEMPVKGAALAVVGGGVHGAYIAGGHVETWDYELCVLQSDSSFLWNFDGVKWAPRRAMHRPRTQFALLPLGEENLYAVGGLEQSFVDCYDVLRDQWHIIEGPGHMIWGKSATLTGRRIYALRNFETCTELDILNLGSGEWSKGPRLTEAREYPGLVSVGGRLVALGGRKYDRSVEVLDLRAGRWELLEGFQLEMDWDTNNQAAVCTIDV